VAGAEVGPAAHSSAAVSALAAVDRADPATAVVTLDATRVKVAETEVALQLAMLQKQNDDRHLQQAHVGVEELRQEARDIAETTVSSAINTYRNSELNSELEASVFELTDLNQGLRAATLSDAALVADAEVFNRFYDKQKDLEVAEVNLEARSAINAELSERVVELQSVLENEQSWLAQLEERNIQQLARRDSVKASTWAQNRGRKVGFYLLTCPVDGPHSFIDSWGYPRSGGRRHKGVDILAAPGVPIVAPVSGRVEHRSNRVGGRSFHLRDDNGNYFYGTHMSGYGKSGDVNAGEVIGYVGDDGNAAGIPHLHFEIHAGGRGNQINPFIDSAAVCSGARN
jgi:murein DD-endopeptidase MepM/ murein hydrolase activator NlpD